MTREEQARLNRDIVYNQTSSDHNWENCRDNWMRPESFAWLEAEAEKETNKLLEETFQD